MAIDAQSCPQILEHLQKSVAVTLHDTRWIPGTAKFAAVGQHARGTGCIQVYQLDGADLASVSSIESGSGFKCSSFGASSISDPQLAVGSFDGKLQLWDLEHAKAPLWDVQAHASIVNGIDGFGGQALGYGPPELVTCGRDGCVRVWDVRQRDAPVAAFEPEDSNNIRQTLETKGNVVIETPMSQEARRLVPGDCWCVAIGNSHNDDERCVLAGYDNGDVKLFDLRTSKLRWETNVNNGVCGVAFDRRDIPMNKLFATCLESVFHVYDARTQHPSKGLAGMSQRVGSGSGGGSTVWGAHPLPQDREVAMMASGDGSVSLWRYHYPDQRKVKDQDGKELGVVGSMQQVSGRQLSTQPINAFSWSPDKKGLFVCSSFDQCIRVGFVTKLHRA